MSDSGSGLAARQAALLQALWSAGPPPEGAQADRFAVLARTLADKRRTALARAWPATGAALAASFAGEFAAHARQFPTPHPAGPLADGARFVLWLCRRGAAPRQARRELVLALLDYRWPHGLLERRRGLRAACLWRGGWPWFALALPFGGPRWLLGR